MGIIWDPFYRATGLHIGGHDPGSHDLYTVDFVSAPQNWAAVKELHLSYHNSKAISFTTYLIHIMVT